MPAPRYRLGLWDKLIARRWQIGFGLLVAAAIATCTYWQMFAPVDVRSQEVIAGEIVAEVMGTGTLGTHVDVTISANVTGLLSEVLVDQGDQVKAGQAIARLDDRDLRRQVKVEEANVSARKATLDRLIADRNSATSMLELSTKSHERAAELISNSAISQEEYEIRYDALIRAKAGLEQAEAALVEGQKLLIAAEETLEYQKARLAYTVVNAPFDGLIVRRDRDPGDVVVPGTSIFYLVSLNEIWVSAWVDETMQASVKPGQPARLVFRSEPAVDYRGTVMRIARETDPETREFLVDVQPEKLPERWSIGQRAEVYIETQRESQATQVPSSFLARRGDKTGVFVASRGRARWRPLTIGIRGRETVEVLGNLAPREIVVTSNDPRGEALADGRRVRLP
jgi:HlyD family secretion protein